MSQLSLSHTLVAGTAENINDVQDNFDDITTWANGSLSDTNFAASSGMYASYRTLLTAGGHVPGGTTAGTYWLPAPGSSVVKSGTADTSSPTALGFNSTDYAITGRTQRLRLRALTITNATAPAITFTFGLYPISSSGGAAATLSTTLGAVTAGSTVAVASPSASTQTSSPGSAFAIPANGNYALGVVLSGGMPANAIAGVTVVLQTNYV